MHQPNGHTLTATARIASWSAIHRWLVVSATLLTLVVAIVASAMVEVQLQTGEGDVGESARALETIREEFRSGSNSRTTTEQLLMSHPSIVVSDEAYQAAAEDVFADLLALPQVRNIQSAYDQEAPGFVSNDGHVMRAIVTVDREVEVEGHRADAILETVNSAAAQYDDERYTVSIVGNLTTGREASRAIDEDFGRILTVTLGLGLIILLLAFGAVVAAIIPLLLAVGAIAIASGLAVLLSHAYALNEIYTEMILLLGLAVGIDYSLFIVSRFRREREVGREKYAAITAASNTTGRAVFFAGITVLVSLAGLMLTNHPIFVSLALAAMLVVGVTIIGSLTFLPAVLAIIGDNVDRLRVPFLQRVTGGNRIWSAITDRVLARPAVFATVVLVSLLALSAPATALNLGFPTGSEALHNSISGKAGLRLLEEHFTSGFTDPSQIVVTAPDVTTPEVQSAIDELIARMNAQPDRFFGPFETTLNAEGDAALIRVPMSGTTSEADEAVRLLRNDLIPEAFEGTDAEALVGGFPPADLDFREFIVAKVPWVFAFVLGIAFVLLLVMFRSVVIPVKSILLNLLSVGAAYGVLVMVFQWGWGIGLLNAESSGVIITWLPLFLFAILFGLSMDYHMLLLNRVKEAYDTTHDNERSVSLGIRLTAGQITSAAAIMVGVFSAFAFIRDVGLQQFGVGLGVSVLIDATVIRSVLLPATMKLLGDWNWYLPSWLDWLPHVSLAEPEPAHPESVAAQP